VIYYTRCKSKNVVILWRCVDCNRHPLHTHEDRRRQEREGGVPELVKVAVRALSAPTTAGAGKRTWSTYAFIVSRQRNWSTYGFIVSRLRNNLSALRDHKLVFVHYNERVIREVNRVNYEAGAFEWDPVEGSDVPVEGSESEDSKQEIEEGA
jgi:hypothetical protein